jgi:hypothetical protein
LANIAEILAQRRREATPGTAASTAGAVVSGIIVAQAGPRFVVSVAGMDSFAAETIVTETLREGDRVWIATGKATAVIVGLQGRDSEFD